ncbi:MAG: phospholipase [Alphaproteobacteria bacterium]|nr:phospholipase [Alphaproteobacteria bacterium]MBU1516231.1 phospholipase [Alphaproteobacteria bacterium]MBU2095768.1 phospholipase [Alphaproteobacteria bacterium]MBU2151985.1 phospholipase [Alphaproteobacteria bacterium]MBU2306833.1 phospholipase [Alphaproteobacteria bacterium]
MEERELDDLVAFLPPLLQALERLGFVARYLNPQDFEAVMAAIGAPDAELRAQVHRLDAWPPGLAEIRAALIASASETLAAYEGLRAAPSDPDSLTAIFRALRHLPRAQEALYPLAHDLAPVSRVFLDPAVRENAGLLHRLSHAAPSPDTGVLHYDNAPDSRGGFSAYVPEYYDPGRPWPLVVALHGGGGNGRSFLWSWLRDARSRGAIVVAPTAIGRTWAITGDDPDTPNLGRLLGYVRGRWNIDPTRILLTGMSDGGTFCYVSGLEPASPFTHLAPVSAAFHPMLASFADPGRLAGLPIHIVHGALDWMFPVDMAREAARDLGAAGAAVTYVEIDDLSHSYPREANAAILDGLEAG